MNILREVLKRGVAWLWISRIRFAQMIEELLHLTFLAYFTRI